MHIKTTSVEGAYTLQQEAGRYFRSQILPVLEKLFDAVNDDEHVLILDRVEIDLGVLKQNSRDQLISENELYPLIQKQFEDYLRSENAKGSTIPEETHFTASQKKTTSFHAFDQWLYYMQQGVLPWSIKSVDEKIRMQVLEVLSTDSRAVTHLTGCIQREPAISTRIVRQHEEQFLVKLVEGISGEKQNNLPELIHSIEDLLKGGSNQRTREELWQLVLQEVVRNGSSKNTQGLLKELCRTLLPLKNQTDQQLFATAEKWPLLKGILLALTASSSAISKGEQTAYGSGKQTYLDSIPQKPDTKNETAGEKHPQIHSPEQSDRSRMTDHTKIKETEKNVSGEIKGGAGDQVKNADDPASPSEKPVDLIRSKVTGPQTEDLHLQKDISDFQTSTNDLLEEGIFVKHAGLILLHPFFQFLFRNTGLSKGIHFTDRYAQQQAIYLLHYIATGETKAEEHQLPIPKLICGWSITEPVLKDVALTGSMLMEADDLIRAAIAQWNILKSTSIEGLRESFLQREGKVFSKSDKIYIQVEKSSIDILLDHLPWNTSIVKFPWFKEILWVEWR